jgi:hypothetical protein
MVVMNRVTLLPNTKRLKQVITEHGNTWAVIRGPLSMQCFNGDLGFQVTSLDNLHIRNVRVGDIKSE